MDTDAIKQRLRELIVSRLNLEVQPSEIKDDAPLFGGDGGGLGLDSVDALEIAVAVTTTFEIEVSDQDVAAFKTVDTIADLFRQKRVAEANA